MNIIKEFLIFIFRRKKYWLIPILLAFLLFGSLIMLTKGTVIAPFIYTLF